jgi:hypothetical protein
MPRCHSQAATNGAERRSRCSARLRASRVASRALSPAKTQTAIPSTPVEPNCSRLRRARIAEMVMAISTKPQSAIRAASGICRVSNRAHMPCRATPVAIMAAMTVRVHSLRRESRGRASARARRMTPVMMRAAAAPLRPWISQGGSCSSGSSQSMIFLLGSGRSLARSFSW